MVDKKRWTGAEKETDRSLVRAGQELGKRWTGAW
jgi:hypothetical protein